MPHTASQRSAYRTALESGRKKGAAHASDAELMAALLETTLQIMVGALSPELVWEGAQKAGLTSMQVQTLVAKRDLKTLDDLMWS
jgi:hypothetical protein